MFEITLIGPNSQEVFVKYEECNPKKPIRLYLYKSEIPANCYATQWRPTQNSLFVHAQSPEQALAWFLENGYQAIGEEQHFLETGKWE